MRAVRLARYSRALLPPLPSLSAVLRDCLVTVRPGEIAILRCLGHPRTLRGERGVRLRRDNFMHWLGGSVRRAVTILGVSWILSLAPGAIHLASLVIGHAVDVLDIRIVLVRKVRHALLLPSGDITALQSIMAIFANPFRVLRSNIPTVEKHSGALSAPLAGGPWAGWIGGQEIVNDGRIRLTNRAKLRPAAGAIKTDPFPSGGRHASFTRMLCGYPVGVMH